MEVIIIICLIIIIALLLQDKIEINWRSEKKAGPEIVNPDLPEIMGKPKPIQRLFMPIAANECQVAETEVDPDSLDIEYDENEIVGIQIPDEELDEVFSAQSEFDEEDEEWNLKGSPVDDFGFAQGVTFDELANVGKLLQQDRLEQAQKKEAIEIVQKIQGTELFYLLESSIEGASIKIAKLLDKSIASTEAGSSKLADDDISGFDIGEFV